jgi:hypothetical protein
MFIDQCFSPDGMKSLFEKLLFFAGIKKRLAEALFMTNKKRNLKKSL